MWQWEEMGITGKWSTVRAPEPPVVSDGRIKKAEGQGARVRGLRQVEDIEETNSNT